MDLFAYIFLGILVINFLIILGNVVYHMYKKHSVAGNVSLVIVLGIIIVMFIMMTTHLL